MIGRLVKIPEIPFEIKAGIGFAWIIVVGGALNFLSAIDSFAITTLIGVGILFSVYVFAKYIHTFRQGMYSLIESAQKKIVSAKLSIKTKPVYIFFIIILITFIGLRVVSMVAPNLYNIHDDTQGYFVFPEKMMQTGSMQTDPFSERRIVSSLGGKAFIDSIFLIYSDVRFLHFSDRGFGFLLFLLVLWGILKSIQLKKEYIVALLYIPVLIMAPMANITSIYTGSVLFAVLCYFLIHHIRDTGGEKRSVQNLISTIVLFSLCMAGLMVLKTSFIPVAGLFALAFLIGITTSQYKVSDSHMVHQTVSYGVWHSMSQKTKTICIYTILLVSIVFLLALPYMLVSYASSGTLLYPLLGKGFHGSAQGQFLTPTSEVSFTNVLNFVYGLQHVLVYALFTLSAIWIYGSYKDRQLSPYAILGIVGVGSALGIGILTAGFAISHYAFAFLLPITIILLAEMLKRYIDQFEHLDNLGNSSSFVKSDNDSVTIAGTTYIAHTVHKVSLPIAVLILGFLLGAGAQLFFQTQKETLGFLSASIKAEPLLDESKKIQYKNLQESVPVGKTILVRLNDNYALDFNRNQIFIADYPGGASLPPGMPCFQGAQTLADYLVSQNIFFIAYSYKDQAHFTYEEYGHRLQPSMNAWIRTEAEHTFDFQDNLISIGENYMRIYDDGTNFVVDLRSKVQ
jgi:hypothetical protein